VTATDGCLNSSTCLVTYVWTEDTTLPQFTGCPTSTIDLGCNPARPSCATAATGITASDSCSGNIIPVCTAGVVGTNGCHLSQAFTLKATDGCGNVGTCVVSYIWTEDTTPPVFDTPPFAVCNQTNFLACNVDESTIPICLATITATDSCSAAHVGCTLVQTTNLCAGSLTDGVRTRIITYEADDVCKNTNFCRQVYIWLVDHTPPVFTKCPANINLGCNPNTFPGCDLSPANVAATDACGSTPIITCSVSSDSVNGCVHTRTNIYAASDSCGNTNFCRQVLTWKVDALAFSPQPFADCTGSTTNNLGCNPDPDTIPHCLTAIHATGGCSSNHVSCSLVQTTNQTTCVRTRIITYTADDDCFTNTCRQVYIWTEDPLKPVFTVFPQNLNLGCNPTNIPGCNLDPTNVFATKDCPTGFVPPITCMTNETIAGCVRTRKLIYTATGAGPCFNTQSKTQTIIYTVDTDPPVFTRCPTNINLGCNPASIPGGDTSTNNVNATGCGPLLMTVATNDVVNGCTNTRTLTYTAQTACTNLSSCSHTITWIVDTNAPVFANCPAPVLALGCNPPSIPSTNSYTVTATDDCGTPAMTTNQVETVTNCVHTRTLTWTATDFCGNTTNCQQVVTWTTDSTPPVFTKCPTNVNLGCNPNPNSIPVCDLTTNSVIVGDDCTLTNLSCAFVDATNNCVRTRTFTYLAQDECGNSSTCIYTVTWTVDTVGPVLSGCPALATLALGCNPNPTNIPTCSSYNVTVSDNCGATVSCASVDTTNGCARTRTLTWTAVDGCNHSTNCHQTITWTQDTTPPTMVNCPAPTLNLGCNPQTVPVCTSYAVGATDNCSASVTCSSSLTMSNGCQRIRILTYVGKDPCGNTNSCQQMITWTEDTTPPVFTVCPTNMNLGTNPPPASIPDCDTSPANVAATDDCGVTPTITCAKVDTTNPTNTCLHTRTLTYTAKDGCGNTNVCTQVITWTGSDTPPTLSVVLQGTNVVISWPVTCNNYVLEQTASLNPSSWSPVSLPPYPIVGGQYSVTIPITGANAFYRLRFP